MPSVLLIDDDGELVMSLSRALRVQGLDAEIEAATSAESALEMFQSTAYEVVVLDLSLDDKHGVDSGFELLSKLKSQDPTVRIIMLTGHGSIDHGIRALALGAANFLEKPANVSHLKELIVDGISQSRLRRDFEKIKNTTTSLDSIIIGSSSPIQKLKSEIEFAASNQQSVLLLGETGTGKGLCARAIHALSKGKEFVLYQPNYSGADLVNSDLFGHKAGSFTGAESDRKGLLLRAAAGTLFLDEIDALPLESQVLLLGVLQDKEFRPVGSDSTVTSNFRIISATNADLNLALENKTFRQDLYHRIAQLELKLPALRDRKEDIPELASYFLEKLRQQEGLNVYSIAENVLGLFSKQNWPGNVRQLQTVVINAAYRAAFKNIDIITLAEVSLGEKQVTEDANLSFREQVENFKIQLINQALKKSDNNQAQAAKDLSLDRSTLRRILSRN
ncbi:MAG: sigma-54 dependent transcriptional regulator [Bdellovibrionota bacterium]